MKYFEGERYCSVVYFFIILGYEWVVVVRRQCDEVVGIVAIVQVVRCFPFFSWVGGWGILLWGSGVPLVQVTLGGGWVLPCALVALFGRGQGRRED